MFFLQQELFHSNQSIKMVPRYLCMLRINNASKK